MNKLNFFVARQLCRFFKVNLLCARNTKNSVSVLITLGDQRFENLFLLLRRLPRYAHYAAALAAEIFKANLTVMRAILSGRPCRPAIRRVHLPLREEGSRMLLANSITLTPGTVTVAVEDEDFLVLCLDAESADALPDWKLTTMLTKMEEETCS